MTVASSVVCIGLGKMSGTSVGPSRRRRATRAGCRDNAVARHRARTLSALRSALVRN